MKNIHTLSNIFWHNKTANRETAVFLKGEIKALKKEILREDFRNFIKVSKNNPLSKFSIISSVYSFILDKYFENYQNIIKVYPSLLLDLDQCVLIEIENNIGATFKTILQNSANELKQVFSYKNYTSSEVNLDSFSNFSIQFGHKIDSLIDDISLLYKEVEDHIVFTVFYNENYPDYVIENLLKNVINILSNYEDLLNKNIKDYSFVQKEELHKLLVEFNDTKVDYPSDKTIVQLFEEQVKKTAENLAIVFEGTELTYWELNEYANQLGAYLRQNYHIQSDDLVAIKLERSEKMIIAILGILKSGAAYVPIDPEYPQDRIEYIEQDANAKVTINEAFLESFQKAIHETQRYSKENLPIISKPESLIYVIYTSGTTGQPKGVMIENHSLINRLVWMQKAYSLSTEDTILQKTTYSFDVSVWELLWWSMYGAKLSILAPKQEKNPLDIIENINKNEVTVIHFVPSMLMVFLNYLNSNKELIKKIKSLRQVFVSGEALTIPQRDLFYKLLPEISLMNLYGPTEASIDVTYFDCSDECFVQSVPIGKPIDNTRMYILDESMKINPVGVAGKLYIAGVGLSRGYLNKPGLTAEKFIENPLHPGTRMYDTGDLARWLPDGNIEFLGRKDFQVKIRGYRIELGEIDNNISRFSEAINQVVTDARGVNGEKVLVSYYIQNSSTPIDKTALREYLQSKLPEYMVPGFFVELDVIPLTPNGKADRSALPDVTGGDLIRHEYTAPRNDTEEKLAEIWQEVLGIDKVGITDSFFELGGHSLMAAQVLNRIHQSLSMQLNFRDFFASPTIEGITKSLKGKEFSSIPKAPEQDSYPLTPSQKRLWVLSQLEGGSQAYNMPAAVTLRGKLNTAYFEKAFRHLIERHEIFRTSFKPDKATGEIRQYITPKEEVSFTVKTLDFTDKNESETQDYLHSANSEAFNLEESPVMRATLLKRGHEDNLFFLSMHHIIGDGWSTEVLVSEIVETYNRLLKDAGKEAIGADHSNIDDSKAEPLAIQYKDYAVWLEQEIKGEKYRKAEAYWLEQFEGEIPVMELPNYSLRPLIRTYNGDSISRLFSKEFTQKLKTYSAQQEATLFMTLMAGVKALLYRYTGQKDIIVGTPIAGRDHPDLENQIGLYLNTLAIRTRLEEEHNTFESLLKKEKSTLLSAYEHQLYPFDELVSKLDIKRDAGRSALFDVLVVFQNQNQLSLGKTKKDIDTLEIQEYEYHRKTSQFDITYNFSEEEKQIKLNITYNKDIYDQAQIKRMLAHFENLISLSIDGESIEETDFLTENERQQLLVDFNATEAEDDEDEDKTIIDWFEDRVSEVPDSIALVFGDIQLTYLELYNKVNRMVSLLRDQGADYGDKVIVSMPLYPDKAIISALGIMKLGAVYVPVEPDVPDDRLRFIVEDVQCKIALVDTDTFSRFSGLLPLLEIEKSELSGGENNITENRSQQDGMAYIIYTSGSTGNPKGVMISHGNLNDYFCGLSSKICISDNSSFAMMSTISTDLGNTVLYSSLIYGKTLHVFTRSQLRDVEYIKKYFNNRNIDCIKIVPSYWKELVQHENEIDFPAKMIIFGGEELTGDIITNIQIKSSGISIINHYGPTETTIGKLLYSVSGNKLNNRIPIGNIFGNNSAYVADIKGNLCPLGVVGELLIGGKGVSKGYINNDSLTDESFIDYKLNNRNSKAYKTGDLVYRNEQGDIVYVGRKDNQVKILGNRVEFAEIEKLVNTFPGIMDNVTHILSDEKGEKRIVSYIVTNDKIQQEQTQEIKQYLKNKLPYYMVPHIIHPIDAIPLGSNGKVNRKALPKPQMEAISTKGSILQNDLEREITEIWHKILNKEFINRQDNFFEIGGNSLKGVRFVNQIRKIHNVDLGLEHIFHYPTVAEIADFIDKNRKRQPEKNIIKVQQKEGELFDLSSNQRRLWVLSHDENTSKAYNITSGLLIEGDVNVEKLISSYRCIINKYDSFRSSFIFDGENPKQRVQDTIEPLVEIISQDYIDENQLQKILEKENDIAFNLEAAPLSSLKIYSLSPVRHFLVLKAHHIITDGWSTNILIQEWFDGYKKLCYAQELDRKKSEYSYQDFVNWQKDFQSGEKYKEGEKYWQERLHRTSSLNLEEHDFLSKTHAKSNIAAFTVEGQLYERIKSLSVDNKVSVYSFLLTSYYLTLYYITKHQNIALGTSVVGRPEQEFENVIGFFVNTVPLITYINPKYSISEYTQQVYKNITDDISHQYIPLENIVKNIGNNLDALFQGRFVMNEDQHSFSDLLESTDIKSVKLYTTNTTVSKFDHSMVMRISGNSLSGSIEYKSEKFSGQYMDFITKAYLKILEILVENPNSVIEQHIHLIDNLKKEYMEKKQNNSFENFLNSINK